MAGEKVLVGFEPDRRGEDALALAATAVHGTQGLVTVATIRPAPWSTPGPGKVDAEWEAYLDAQARENLDRAAEYLGGRGCDVAEYAVGKHRGSGRGLSQLASRTKSDMVIIGSAPKGPRTGIALGSTADQLLHGSPVPVMIAPKGYATRGLDSFDRVTVAYLRRPESAPAVALAADVAVRRGIPLRLLTFAVGHTAKGKAAMAMADEQLRRLVEVLESDLALAAKEAADGSRLTKRQISTEVAEGKDTASAVAATDWTDGDLLVCSSSTAGPIKKVFMGDMSLKIVRAAPCPVMVLPRTR
ncbi:universal stress protein [Actinocorallia longicatena]|uniref:Universal stress protein n=1 Tax=Actinocorallia longicatena TaxID=111803 RepID=A0ABP6QJ43_9ACTN